MLTRTLTLCMLHAGLFCNGQITGSLIAHYPFCGDAMDHSGNSLHGTVHGANLATDRFGNTNSAYSFNGTSSYISLPTGSFVGRDVYSVSMWLNSAGSGSSGSLAWSVGSNDPFCQSISYNSSVISAGSYNQGSNPVQSYVFSGQVGLNQWVHVVTTRDMNELKLYINGTQVPATTGIVNGQQASYGATSPFRAVIGGRSTLSGYFFNGKIDDVRIYGNVLSPQEVSSLYNEASQTPIVNSGTICAGEAFVIAPSGNGSYSISGGQFTVQPASTSGYTITSSGCVTHSAIATVTVHPLPATMITTSGTMVCAGDQVVMQASGASSYSWSTGQNVPTILVLPAPPTSTYQVTGFAATGCSMAAQVTLTVNECTAVKPEPLAQNILVNGRAAIPLSTPSPGSTFVLLNLNGQVVASGEINPTQPEIRLPFQLEEGLYLLSVGSAGGRSSVTKIWVMD